MFTSEQMKLFRKMSKCFINFRLMKQASHGTHYITVSGTTLDADVV